MRASSNPYDFNSSHEERFYQEKLMLKDIHLGLEHLRNKVNGFTEYCKNHEIARQMEKFRSAIEEFDVNWDPTYESQANGEDYDPNDDESKIGDKS